MFTVPEQSLASEFPAPDTAKRVLEAVGGTGGRTFSNIAAAAGDRAGPVSSGTLSPLLHRLVDEKQILAVDRPLIKWQDGPFDRRHLDDLQRHAPLIPGFEPGISGLVVSRSGADLPVGEVDLIWGPDNIVQAWSA